MEAMLVVEQGPHLGSSWTVREGKPLTLGRGPGAQVRLDGDDLLPKHATLVLAAGGLTLTDLGGPAGTFVDGRRAPANVPVPVPSGAALRLGATVLRVEGDGLPSSQRATVTLAPLREDPLLPATEFETLRELGKGASGQVFAVRRKQDGRLLAAKLLVDDVDPASEEFRRFLAEGRAASRVQSPFVVGVVDLRLHDRRAALLLELVDGPSLARLLERGPLAVPDALEVGEHLAEALAAVHAAGVVHRDVKPGNVLLDPHARLARLTDFGIAKELGGSKGPTRSGQGLGTLSYIAPEQLMDAKRVGPAADLHALGATLYHCLAGTPPHVAGNFEQLLRKVAFEAPPPLADRRPETPPEALRLVGELLAKEPADRRATARQAADALRQARLHHFPRHRSDALFTPS